MRFIIRSSDHGVRFPAEAVEAKKKAVREKILAAGFHYLEFSAQLGLYDTSGEEIREQVTIIEAVAEATYV